MPITNDLTPSNPLPSANAVGQLNFDLRVTNNNMGMNNFPFSIPTMENDASPAPNTFLLDPTTAGVTVPIADNTVCLVFVPPANNTVGYAITATNLQMYAHPLGSIVYPLSGNSSIDPNNSGNTLTLQGVNGNITGMQVIQF